MQVQGWTLLFHDCVVDQLRKLHAATQCAQQNDPQGFEANANVKLFRALSQVILERVPCDPSRDEFRQGNTLGSAYRHWRRAKIGRRFRLFFRYDSKAKVIVYAWVNDEQTLRSAGSNSDPYAVFEKMLGRSDPIGGKRSRREVSPVSRVRIPECNAARTTGESVRSAIAGRSDGRC